MNDSPIRISSANLPEVKYQKSKKDTEMLYEVYIDLLHK